MTMHGFRRIFYAYSGQSRPTPDASKYPAQDEIRAVLDTVHEQVLWELPKLAEAELDLPVLQPHPIAKAKLSALLWCANHEMLHAGQIGLLRRHLGYSPMW